MEKVIGIFDEQPTYAERLKKYINERKDIGCYAVTFRTEEELVQFFERKKAGCLITGEEAAKDLYEHGIILPLGVSQWVLTEEKREEEKMRNEEIEKKEKKFEGKKGKKMELKIWGRAEDIQELVSPLIDYMGEKLKITVEPCPIEENEPRRFYVEVERKKNTENKM